MKAGFFKQLCEIAGKENVRTDEPMKQHTTFRIGGAADYFVSPQTTDQIKNIIDLCKSEAMPWYVIGNGSNLLVSDRGFRGVIIQLFKNFSDLRVEGPLLPEVPSVQARIVWKACNIHCPLQAGGNHCGS